MARRPALARTANTGCGRFGCAAAGHRAAPADAGPIARAPLRRRLGEGLAGIAKVADPRHRSRARRLPLFVSTTERIAM